MLSLFNTFNYNTNKHQNIMNEMSFNERKKINENNMRKMRIMFEKNMILKSFKLKRQCASYKKSSCIFFKDDPPFSILHFPVAFFPHHFLFPPQIMVLDVVYFLCNFFDIKFMCFFGNFSIFLKFR